METVDVGVEGVVGVGEGAASTCVILFIEADQVLGGLKASLV